MNPFSHLFICRFSDVHTSPSLVLVFRLAVTCCIVLALPGSLLLGMGGVHEKPILAPSPCTVPGHPPDLTCGIHTSPNNRHPSQALHPPALTACWLIFRESLCQNGWWRRRSSSQPASEPQGLAVQCSSERRSCVSHQGPRTMRVPSASQIIHRAVKV